MKHIRTLPYCFFSFIATIWLISKSIKNDRFI